MGDWEKILRDLSETDYSHGGFFKQALDEHAKLKQERDEAVALVEVMREFVASEFSDEHGGDHYDPDCDICRLLSLTPSAALREIQARVLEEAAQKFAFGLLRDTDARQDDSIANSLREMAAAKRKGE